MRWKLFFLAAIIAALAGASASVLALLLIERYGLFENLYARIAVAIILPSAAITYASFFVYRHTSRRRQLQGALTAVAASLLTVAFVALYRTLTKQ